MDSEDKNYNVILTGFMGTGKTTVGRLLAEKLEFEFVDTDVLIEDRAGKTVAEIFVEDGERTFRQMERDAARDLGEQVGQVIATGGRMMLDPENITSLAPTGSIFCLTASPDEILKRVMSDTAGMERPLLKGDDPKGRIKELLAERQEKYGRFEQIETEALKPQEICDQIVERVVASNESDEAEASDA